jgi:ketosteroid isomerase-like protein
MKISLAWGLLLVLATCPVLSVLGQKAAQPTKKGASAEEEVRRSNEEEVKAFLHRDPGELARLWSDDLVVTNPLNKFVHKQQVLRMVESGMLVITGYDRKIEYVHVFGDTAIVAGSETVTFAGKMPLTGETVRLRFTGIWMKQHGSWLEVARHANVVPDGQSG